ncbi:MAG: protein translocase subunit SecD [Microbacteriaceae bacterium]
MATTRTPVQLARRSLIWLGLIFVSLLGINWAAVTYAGGSWTPKLALDLEGGTQIILAARLESGETIKAEDMKQAVEIIRQRVDSSGVSESEIVIQGERNIVISLPGTPDQETMNRLEASAKLEFREIWLMDNAETVTQPTAEPTPPATTEPPADAESMVIDKFEDLTQFAVDSFGAFTCATADLKEISATPANEVMIACSADGGYKFLLSPVRVDGKFLSDAFAGTVTTSTGANLGQWAVTMQFKGEGITQLADMTRFLFSQSGVRNMFAIMLDGEAISYPSTNGVIPDGKPQITGSFTQLEAQTLANQLRFGALPLSFDLQSTDTISPTLGKESLTGGMIAGLIGLLLVLIYSLFQYRTLGLVTFASLIVAGILTYLLLTILSWRQGYRLSLAGVTGVIVAIGITADSFIVYFERIKDELRDGRMLVTAVENGWKRALRTIFASDAVNFLAAAVLFVLAVGGVQGFAFTLGLTTIIDILVVSLFTHPLLQFLAKTKFFGGGHLASGLDPQALGAVYRGRAQFREPVIAAQKNIRSTKEAVKRQTIAERKALAQADEKQGNK